MKILNKLDQTFSLEQNFKIIIDAIRGTKKENISSNFRDTLVYLQNNPELLSKISKDFHEFFLNSKLSTHLAMFGILSKSGFRDEFWNRVYEKFIPAPPNEGDIKYLLQRIFTKKDDYL